MSQVKWLVAMGVGVLLSACAGRQVSLAPATETLTPEISQDGTKFFTFRRDYLSPGRDPGELLPGQNVRRQSQQPLRPELQDEALERRLREVFARTGYCREGYFVLFRDRGREAFLMRGECREDASAEDRQRFSGEAIVLPAS